MKQTVPFETWSSLGRFAATIGNGAPPSVSDIAMRRPLVVFFVQ